jgi:H+/Cl- antiporter ClcA
VGAGRGGRVRRPRPLLRERLPSGRGAREQPNTTDETARLTPVLWALLLVTAVATGLLGSTLMFLLTTVEHLAFGYDSGTLEDGAEHASAVRRVASLVVAGAFGGVAWYLLRRYVPGGPTWTRRSGAAALIGAAMQAPLSALVLVLELTHVGFGLVVPMTVAVVVATAVARWVDGHSIYSARLSTISP